MSFNKPKLVLLSCFYEPYMSGAEQLPREVIARLGDKYDITLLSARMDDKLAFIEQFGNYRLIRLGIGHKKIDKILYPVLAALKVREIAPAITHANLESYAGIALAWIKYFVPDTKRILSLQSGNLLDEKQKNRFFINLFWRSINFAPHKLIAISNFLKQRSLDLGIPESRIAIIPNGVDFSKVKMQNNPDPHLVFFAGRLSWEKGAEFMFKAWPAVLERFPDAKLLQVGGGDMRDEIIGLLKLLKIENSVILKPIEPYDDFLKEYEKAAIMICPSLAEGLGIAFIEAQASGVPAIGTNVGGIPDVIEHEKTGILIEPQNVQAISDAIIRLFEDKDLAERLSANAQQSARRFDWENVINQIDKIYQECLRYL